MAFAPVFQRPFPATFDRRAAAAAAGNGLLNALIAYWPGNEASGDLLDAHTNALHLTDTNTVTNAAGKVYATARQYTAANSEYHTRASEALLQMGDVDMTFASWIYLDSIPTFQLWWLSKWILTGINSEYLLRWNNTTNRLEMLVRDMANTTTTTVKADQLGNVSSGTWYFVVGWHDAGNDQLAIQVNNGTPDVVSSYTGGVLAAAADFRISGNGSGTVVWNGRIGPVAMWKSAAGGGGVLSSSQRSALYNAGNGLAYTAFTT